MRVKRSGCSEANERGRCGDTVERKIGQRGGTHPLRIHENISTFFRYGIIQITKLNDYNQSYYYSTIYNITLKRNMI